MRRSDTKNMFVVAAMVFVLTWAVATALVGLASFGTAPLWLLLGGPLMVAAWATVTMTRFTRPERLRLSRSARILAHVQRIGSSAVDALTFFVPFATLALLVVYALPVRNGAEAAGVAAALLVALLTSVKAGRAIRFPTTESA